MEQKEKNRIILEWITKAKEIYMNTIFNCGMCKSFKLAVLRDSELEKSLICILQNMGHESKIFDSKLLYNPEWPFILILNLTLSSWVGIKLLRLIGNFKTIS